jgi:UDPglucose 6-dehydrogenase
MDECRRRIGDKVTYAKDMYDAVVDADALALLTEWKQFRLPSWTVIERSMKGKTVIDGRNIYNPTDLAETQLELHAIGRK